MCGWRVRNVAQVERRHRPTVRVVLGNTGARQCSDWSRYLSQLAGGLDHRGWQIGCRQIQLQRP